MHYHPDVLVHHGEETFLMDVPVFRTYLQKDDPRYFLATSACGDESGIGLLICRRFKALGEGPGKTVVLVKYGKKKKKISRVTGDRTFFHI